MPKKGTHPVLANEVERLRQAKGLTPEALANKALVNWKNLRRILAGQWATLGTITKIAQALETTPDSIRADSPMRNLLERLPLSSSHKLPVNTSSHVNISATLSMPQQDSGDPLLAEAFFTKINQAMESYERFKIKHNVMHNNALLSPKDAEQYYTSKVPNLKHQQLELVGFFDGKSVWHYYILRSSYGPIRRILSPLDIHASRTSTVSHESLLVVYHVKGVPPKEACEQIAAWYGEILERKIYFRFLNGNAASFFGEGQPKVVVLSNVSNDADEPRATEPNRVLIPGGHSVEFDLETNTAGPVTKAKKTD